MALSKAQHYWWGVLGALGTDLLALLSWLARTPSTSWKVEHLAMGAVIFGIAWIAGAWACAMGGDHEWKAMYHGATFPLVFAFLSKTVLPGH